MKITTNFQSVCKKAKEAGFDTIQVLKGASSWVTFADFISIENILTAEIGSKMSDSRRGGYYTQKQLAEKLTTVKAIGYQDAFFRFAR